MKNILLAVVGLSPQVVTETLYALHQNNQYVDAIHLITTRAGKERVYAELISRKDGHYYQYLEDYGIESAAIDFNERNIHVIKDEHGIERPDILDQVDNERLLKVCLELTFHFTKDPDSALFFSVAGGRKTMSACLSLAAQIYGRPQDRLYHVLVSSEFESNRNFYYPPKKSKSIELIDPKNQPFYKETKYAQIHLIHIPFVSIREKISQDLLKNPEDPATLMLSLNREKAPRLVVNLLSRKIIYKKQELDLMPARMALYAFFAMEKKNCPKAVEICDSCTDCFSDVESVYAKQDQITDLYKKMSDARPLDEMSDTGITNLSADNFNMYKGKIKGELLARFGPYALKDLEIASIGTRPHTRYGLLMDKSNIQIVY